LFSRLPLAEDFNKFFYTGKIMSADIHAQKILILDFGSQYTQLIARRVREAGVYSEIRAFDMTEQKIREYNPRGVILSGGPESVSANASPRVPACVFELGVPVLGICYGMQAMAEQFGGVVAGSHISEFGYAQIKQVGNGGLLHDIRDHIDEHGDGLLDVWMSHGDKVVELPPDFELIAETESCPIAGMAHREKPFYGIQFHPEVTHTVQGVRIFEHFVLEKCGCEVLWTPANIVEDAIHRVQATVGGDKVLLGLSGGVDSSVVAALLHRAIGDQLCCAFVDNGLLRKNEASSVENTFRHHHRMNLVTVDASHRFLSALKGVTDPETKRKIIGETFIRVFEEQARKLGDVSFLVQGTLYPDVIESVSVKGPSATIKSHHNVGGLPEEMDLELVEPLSELFKDEVRAVGRELGLAEEIVGRHPFPGPGLAVRVLGEVTRDRLDILREADDIFISEIRQAGLYDEIWQAFAVLLPIQTVGVMGDERTYDNVVALRAVTSRDGMTADWYPMPHEILNRISNRIINEVEGVNRVAYDVSSKPPATIEWE